MVGWLKHRSKDDPPWVEMPSLPGFNVEEGIPRLREIGMLEWTCHLRPSYPHWQCPEDKSFTNILRKSLWQELQHPWRALWLFVSSARSYSGNHSHSTGKLHEMGVIVSQDVRGQRAALNCQSKVGIITLMDIRIKVVIKIVWIMLTYGIGQLISVSRNEIDRKSTKSFLESI